jgi:hypothetical protein
MISMTRARAMLDNYTGNLNSYFIAIYTGSIPSNCGTANTGTHLASMQFGATAFGASTDPGSTGLATATANAITSDTNAAASGTAGYFTVQSATNSGTIVARGTCGTSSADMIMNTTTITAGDTIACSSFVITLPDGSGND